MDLIRARGFDAVSIKDIVGQTGVPKGSFHYYFDSKEAYGLELMDFFGDSIRRTTLPALQAPGKSSLERLRGFFRAYADRMHREKYQMSCLNGLISMESSARSEPLREKAEDGLGDFQKEIWNLLKEARKSGEIRGNPDLKSLAGFIVNSWEGALLRMKVQRSPKALRDFDRIVFEELLPGK